MIISTVYTDSRSFLPRTTNHEHRDTVTERHGVSTFHTGLKHYRSICTSSRAGALQVRIPRETPSRKNGHLCFSHSAHSSFSNLANRIRILRLLVSIRRLGLNESVFESRNDCPQEPHTGTHWHTLAAFLRLRLRLCRPCPADSGGGGSLHSQKHQWLF